MIEDGSRPPRRQYRTLISHYVASVLALAFAALVVAASLKVARGLARRAAARRNGAQVAPISLPSLLPLRPEIPIGKMPGPPRDEDQGDFQLNERNALRMIGMDDGRYERWADLAGKYYTAFFISRFSYEHPVDPGPEVRLRIDSPAPTLKGRLEARRLKPNFVYQVKLRGLFADRTAFERIGRVGRWRLPGIPTNYIDEDYEQFPNKEEVEAYILFDYFATDAQGNAVREFALDSSLHVVWNARQRPADAEEDILFVPIDCSDPAVYSRARMPGWEELLWAEREVSRYSDPDHVIRLPAGPYKAELVLTEESFHAWGGDGGWWATVYRCPIDFVVER